MNNNEKLTYMRQAVNLAGFSLNDKGLEMLISLYDLIRQKKGRTTLKDVTKTVCDVSNKHDKKMSINTEVPGKLPIWVVYYSPEDFPDKYVTRKFLLNVPTEEFYVADSIEEIREYIPKEMVQLSPSENDPKIIVEIYV